MPRRGEVWMIDFGIAQKVRPALILSVGYDDKDRALITVVTHTTTLRGSRFELASQNYFLKAGAFVAQSITTVPPSLALRKLGTVSDAQLAQVEGGVRAWLGL
jgi:mRNA interferase MazF